MEIETNSTITSNDWGDPYYLKIVCIDKVSIFYFVALFLSGSVLAVLQVKHLALVNDTNMVCGTALFEVHWTKWFVVQRFLKYIGQISSSRSFAAMY